MTAPIDPDRQRIAKLLARAGIASRREIERMIADGRVALDGVVLDTPATILPSLDGVTVDGVPVEKPEPARLFRYHKPSGLLTAERDPKGRLTIYDRLPQGLPRVMPVGRLDLNTEGLLLLTTDGELKRQLELPATGVERSYRARAYGHVSQAQLEDLMLGIEIEGVRYGSINANLERRTGTNMWIEMTLTEGKNREVRRVLEHLGLKVSRLIRTRYGPFHLGDLPAGDVDEIRPNDLNVFTTVLNKPGGGKAASNLQFAMRQRVAPPAPQATPVEGPARTPRPDNRPGRARPPAREPERRTFNKAPSRPAPRPFTPREEAPREATDQRRVRTPARPDRAPREDRAPTDRRQPSKFAPRAGAPREDRPRTERAVPARFTPRATPAARPDRPARDEKPREVANPARAARARAHRETGPRDGDFVDRPTRNTPDRRPGKGPSGGRGKPSKPGRPPRTRK